jgi:hypothetical protein
MASEQLNEPTELYNRSKRNLVIFVGLLSLVLLGFTSTKGDTEAFGLHVANEALPTVLFFITIYLLYQYWIAWSFQTDSLRRKIRHDFFVTVVPTAIVIVYYIYVSFKDKITALATNAVVAAAIAVIAVAFAAWMWQAARLRTSQLENVSLRSQTIKDRLLEKGWKLNFNPLLARGTKPISFNKDGTISDGQNVNEHAWRWDGDVLELIREDGSVHNRFEYDPDLDRFISNQPSAVHGIRGQFIYRD